MGKYTVKKGDDGKYKLIRKDKDKDTKSEKKDSTDMLKDTISKRMAEEKKGC